MRSRELQFVTPVSVMSLEHQCCKGDRLITWHERCRMCVCMHHGLVSVSVVKGGKIMVSI
jgi:hypothetical protein